MFSPTISREKQWQRRKTLLCRMLRGSNRASRATRCVASGLPGAAGAWTEWIPLFTPSSSYQLLLNFCRALELLHTTANVGYYGGMFFALFMMGYGTAMIWGPIADRFGRVRTMMFSIFCFSLFTLLAAFATGVWSLAVFRFMAGVGIGGEWSVGAALVAEDWPEERRTMGAALMHTGYYIGFFFAALANVVIGSHYGWRWMFALGGAPCGFCWIGLIRNNVEEPAQAWENKVQELGGKWKMHSAFLTLFSPQYRRRTIVNTCFLIVSLCGLWAGSVYAPTAMTYIAERSVGTYPGARCSARFLFHRAARSPLRLFWAR